MVSIEFELHLEKRKDFHHLGATTEEIIVKGNSRETETRKKRENEIPLGIT